MIIDERQIHAIVDSCSMLSESKLEQILAKAELKKGLSLEEAAGLLSISDDRQMKLLFASAWKVKNEIYGNRLVFFAPLYLSNYCINDCEYCGFHCRNREMNRKKLSMEEIAEETRTLIRMGHKRLLIEVGEDPSINDIDYVCDAIKTIYSTRLGNGEIRRVNVNIAATSADDYRKLKSAGIGTYQLFQETYHRETYQRLHHGPKADYVRQITAMDRAFEAGIDDVGIGVLFGLYDYRFEVLALLSHAAYLDKKFGVGPHTISVPRFNPAPSVDYAPAHPVSDRDFLKLIAVLRLSVPYTGMIISTRERPEIRAKAFSIGISQASAASCTSPGGYSNKFSSQKQFSLHDERSVDEILQDVAKRGLLPSFCTACYRSKRTGEAFMRLAKTGNIHYLCHPNAILTFKEFLLDYASPEMKETGNRLLAMEVENIADEERRKETKRRLERIECGERDLYF